MTKETIGCYIVVYVLIWGLTLLIPFLLATASEIVQYWLRLKKELNWGSKYVELFPGTDGSWEALIGSKVLIGLVGLGVVMICLKTSVPLYTIPLTCLAIYVFIKGPRLVFDICRGLKRNNKTGDLERIKNLEDKVDKLKKRIES